MPRSRKANAPLEDYRAKRDFGATPEPTGDTEPGAQPERARFVETVHNQDEWATFFAAAFGRAEEAEAAIGGV